MKNVGYTLYWGSKLLLYALPLHDWIYFVNIIFGIFSHLMLMCLRYGKVLE